MTTVTSLTADRMLAIEASSVISGTVDANGNLILTTKGGNQINAGKVTGPQGPQGPVGSDLQVLSAVPILDVGMANQIRAGRQLSPADFANIGLNPPIGLWNLSDLTDASGYGRNLQNKGAVTFAPGINGGANTASQFTGSMNQALYISDTGANDPFRLKTASFGCWFRTAKSGVQQALISKFGPAPNREWYFGIDATTGAVVFTWSVNGSDAYNCIGVTNCCNDRWHFAVATFEIGGAVKVYVDGNLEISSGISYPIYSAPAVGPPLNIGAQGADAATASVIAWFGRIDEAFVTGDILTEDQVRNLYCAKIVHTLAAVPSRLLLNIRRRRKGAAFSSSDFPTQPLRLHNFSAGSVADEGSNNVPLTSARVGTNMVEGADGTQNNAYWFNANAGTDFASTDAGLPAAVTARSYGCWFNSVGLSSASIVLMAWGTISTGDSRLIISNNPLGQLLSTSSNDQISGPILNDARWHLVVIVEDNGSLDGIKRKMYVDGALVGSSLVLNPIVLAGANAFRIGAHQNATNPFMGVIDNAFVCGYALTFEQITALYAKGSQALSPSPKNVGDHIEGMDANNLLAIFDTLESQHQVDLKVAA